LPTRVIVWWLKFLLTDLADVGAGGEPEDELGIDLLFALLVDLLGVGDDQGRREQAEEEDGKPFSCLHGALDTSSSD